METQRPYALYLPDNMEFVAKNNAFTEELENIYLTASLMVASRMNCPKMNPSRVYTPVGSVSWGGMTIPGIDILGSKGCSGDKPWLFEEFDQITFYRVSESREEVIFAMAEQNRLLRDTKEEVASIRTRKRQAQTEIDKLEVELLACWVKQKAEKGIPMDTIENLLNDADILPIDAALNAIVWKVEIKHSNKLRGEPSRHHLGSNETRDRHAS
ncbi:hypothetical protein EYZ11_005886 [Aspergillus tanneri]|uniref:Uncharacterized protein n=1 Tax=Aspergillus tanneri TaxID=1220188 RepID=A0A4S3JMR9_9EURO|nr:hypothetical protein EYZ11_005886 [Aspergillus tanneri]